MDQSIPVLAAVKTTASPALLTTPGEIIGSRLLLTTSNSMTIGAY